MKSPLFTSISSTCPIHSSVWLFSIIIIQGSCAIRNRPDGLIEGYRLGQPTEIIQLPDTLREVSGLTQMDSSSIACIQDENGLIFIYDLRVREITKTYAFGLDGDYEGIARIGDTLFVLRSDGNLFRISAFGTEAFRTEELMTGIPAHNNEGLCYDPVGKQLLIASKSKAGKGSQFKDKRLIFGFNTVTNRLDDEPFMTIDLDDLRQYAISQGIRLPEKKNRKKVTAKPVVKLKTSAICFHPVTGNLYLLSAAEHLLCIFRPDGSLLEMTMLDPVLFNKPEGITFLPNGEMLITNEGQEGKPTLVRFRYEK